MATNEVNSTDAGWITLDPSEVRVIRRMLVLGLACYGQLEALIDRARAAEAMGKEIAEGMTPLHPTGCLGDIEDFAYALSALEASHG